RVFILVTDGESSIDPVRFQELKAQIEQLGIKLYVLGIGDDWTSGKQLDLRDFTNAVNGEIIAVGDQQEMLDAFAHIAAITKKPVKLETLTHGEDQYDWFVIAGMFLLLAAKLIASLLASVD
ncbi:MAG: hypothetical protein ACREMY_29365, partial [bacterium]